MNYLDICNEILVRMREQEIVSVSDTDNDPQQKLVCKFVNDAKQFVEGAHTWNALRKIWLVDLAHDVHKYNLNGGSEKSRPYLVRYQSGAVLKEANPRWMERKPQSKGSPHYYTMSNVHNNTVTMNVWPYPDNTFGDSHDVFEFGEAEFDDRQGSELFAASPDKVLHVYGFAHQGRMTLDDDKLLVPEDPVLHYGLGFATRERGESGGASSAEIFALAKQSLSDSISWDVANSDLEYHWMAV